MNQNGRFLLGHGERLTAPLAQPTRYPKKAHSYTFEDAISRLAPQISKVVGDIKSLQPIFCPNDESVFCIDLHPSYLAKSYFPTRILGKLGLRAVGSRIRTLIPDKLPNKRKTEESSSLELFVAGKRKSIYSWYENFDDSDFADDIIKIERIKSFTPKERLKGDIFASNDFEVVLHASQLNDDYIIIGFEKLLKSFKIEPLTNRRIQTKDLCFFPVECAPAQLEEIEKFAFLRVARPIPKMRILNPGFRQVGSACKLNQEFPNVDPVDPTIKVAVFDGGCKIPEEFKRWVKGYVLKDSTSSTEGISHGCTVNSALLFGSISPTEKLETPYAEIHNYQVLGNRDNDRFELYNVLNSIKAVLARPCPKRS